MAKQTGPIRIIGTIGDLTFGENFVRRKTSIDADRFNTDPAFEPQRNCSYDFGKASSAGKYLRRAFEPLTKRIQDKRVSTRMTS